MAEPIVIVGGGLAAARVVESYREAGGAGPVTVVAAEPDPPYHRPGLSKRYLRGDAQREDLFVRPAEWYAEQGVELRRGERVKRLDLDARAVETASGDRIAFGRLVLATGAAPRLPSTPGVDLDGVTTFRTLRDSTFVRDSEGPALVVGSGFIGMEVTASLRTLGRDVTMVCRESGLYGQLGIPGLSRALEQLYRERGVELVAGDEIAEFRGEGRLAGAVTKGGREVAAGVAVLGLGVEPAVALAREAGLEVASGVVVSERFETSADGVYAVGDIAEFWDPLFERRRRIEHWSNASYQGQQLGRLLAGEDAGFDTLSTFFTEVFGIGIKVFGDGVRPDEVLVEQGFSLEQGLAWYVRGGRVEGAVVIGQSDEREAELKELIARRPEPAGVR